MPLPPLVSVGRAVCALPFVNALVLNCETQSINISLEFAAVVVVVAILPPKPIFVALVSSGELCLTPVNDAPTNFRSSVLPETVKDMRFEVVVARPYHA